MMTKQSRKRLKFAVDMICALVICAIFYAAMWTEHLAMRERPGVGFSLAEQQEGGKEYVANYRR